MLPLSVVVTFLTFPIVAEDWLQWRGSKRDGIWRESGIVETIPSGGLKYRWRARIGSGYSGPAVANGRVYLTDRLRDPDRERLICFREIDGKKLWEHEYPCEYADLEYGNGPRATPTVDRNQVVVFGTKAHLTCFDAVSGKLIWKKDLVHEYDADVPRYGASAAPLFHKDLLIAYAGGKPDAMMVAFDRNTGEERWRSLSDRPAYSAPIIIHHAGQDQLIVWTGDATHSLDPNSGKVFWTVPYECGWDVAQTIASPVHVDDRLLFLMGWGRGAMTLKLDTEKPVASELWKTRSKPSTLMATPVFVGSDHFLSVDGQQGLCFIDAANGSQLWSDRRPIGAARMGYAHVTPNADRVFIFNQSGHLMLGRAMTNGFESLGETLLVEPTAGYRAQGPVVWSHPAYANLSVYARNDRELVCASLAASDYTHSVAEPVRIFPVRVLEKFIGMSAARSLAFSPDGSTLAVGTMVGTVRRVDPKTGEAEPPPRLRGRQRNRSFSLAWSGNGKWIACAGGTEFRQSRNNSQTSGYVRIWNAEDRSERPELKGLSNNVFSVSFSPDSTKILTSDAHHRVRLWDAASGEPIRSFLGHADAVWSAAFIPNSARVLSAGWDRMARVWNMESGNNLAILRGHEDAILTIAVSPDGRLAATGSADWTIRLWNLDSLDQPELLQGHRGAVYCLAFSSDGSRLFSGSGDETIRIWNVGQRQTTAILRGHQSGIRSIALSPDDSTLASTGLEDPLRLWTLK